MENKEMFEIMLNQIKELVDENARLKTKIKFYQKYEELHDSKDKTLSNDDVDGLFNPDNYRFDKPKKKVGVKNEVRR